LVLRNVPAPAEILHLTGTRGGIAVTVATVDEYIAAHQPLTQMRLRELQSAVLGAAPGANEVISYGIPTYKVGKAMVSIGAAKRHCALYGAALNAFPEELAAYDTSKGTVRFPLDKPIPAELVRKLVQARFAPDR
jgi:uncharacterized protein YdhG (YjbR/CyaY superfamily)